MSDDRVTLRLPEHLHREALILARDRDITVGQLVRDLLAREIARGRPARLPARADERLVAPLRARLAPHLAAARDWPDLARRLRAEGFALHEAGGGLALHDWPGGRRLCKASELGFSHRRLAERIGCSFPGHRNPGRTIAPRRTDHPGDDPLLEPF